MIRLEVFRNIPLTQTAHDADRITGRSQILFKRAGSAHAGVDRNALPAAQLPKELESHKALLEINERAESGMPKAGWGSGVRSH